MVVGFNGIIITLFIWALGLLIFYMIVKAAINHSKVAEDLSRIRFMLEHHNELHDIQNRANNAYGSKNVARSENSVSAQKTNNTDDDPGAESSSNG